ncbi:MAG: response regulator transcription factor [Magnetococcales bacterium]|nr:response regulator transcription factor [Magnetococcales bacterium]
MDDRLPSPNPPAAVAAPCRVVVVDDDPGLLRDVVEFLNLRGFLARGVGDGSSLWRELARESAELIVLDWMLPGEDGLEIARKLRQAHTAAGVLMLTCRGGVGDQVMGLESGADAYLMKGTDLLVIEATLRSLQRRLTREEPPPADGPPAWSLDRLGWELIAPGGQRVKLNASEMALLEALFRSPGQTVERPRLLAAMDKEETLAARRNLDTMVLRLRRKVEELTGQELPLESSYGKGLVFTARADPIPEPPP